MSVLLIGGAPNTGKTNAVAMCANYLVGRGFKVVACQNYNGKSINIPNVVKGNSSSKDFMAKLTGKNLNGKQITVIMVSASDVTPMIDQNFDFCNGQNYDILISSIRDIGNERNYLLNMFNMNVDNTNVVEFPLAKMSRKNQNWFTAKSWYDFTVQNILSHILKSKPFEV